MTSSAVFLLMLILHSSHATLMCLNGVQQKYLTPVKPDEVVAVISGLQKFAQVVRRDADVPPDQHKNANTRCQHENCTGKVETKSSTIPSPSQTSPPLDAPKLVSAMYELPVIQSQNEIKLENNKAGSGTNVLESIHSLLGMLNANNSNVGVFITNFASTHTHETDE